MRIRIARQRALKENELFLIREFTNPVEVRKFKDVKGNITISAKSKDGSICHEWKLIDESITTKPVVGSSINELEEVITYIVEEIKKEESQ